jgi:hypothetical protein
MKQNKFFSAAIALLLIAFFTTSWVSAAPAHKPTPVTITGQFALTGGTFPNLTFTGPFTITGAIDASGTATMDAAVNVNFIVYHCIWTLKCDNGETITLHEQCQQGSSTAKGRWEIVSGTGIYANLRGNGSSLMPVEVVDGVTVYLELLTGVIY